MQGVLKKVACKQYRISKRSRFIQPLGYNARANSNTTTLAYYILIVCNTNSVFTAIGYAYAIEKIAYRETDVCAFKRIIVKQPILSIRRFKEIILYVFVDVE